MLTPFQNLQEDMLERNNPKRFGVFLSQTNSSVNFGTGSTPPNKKVTVALSGGVDSAVAAVLLKEQGYQIEGVFMKLGIEGDEESERSARAVAKKLGIKFYALDLSREFKKKVIDYFISEYQKGRTPNPCVECNREIKFGLLMNKVLKMGADFVATGHYTRLQREITNHKSQITKFKFPPRRSLSAEDCDEKARSSLQFSAERLQRNESGEALKLLKAKDENKDQSYFLYTLNQKKLKRCLFPLGDYTKDEVRKIAGKNEILKDKFQKESQKESQEVCFITSKYYGDFLKKHLKLKSGDIIDTDNNILGSHKGLPLYTIGQRRDIGIGGTGPYYVIGMNRRKNQLIVSNNKNDKNLFSRELTVKKVNWISGDIPKLPLKIKAKVRYRMKECSATVNKVNNKYTVKFSKPQRAIMPGQSVVFYKGNEVLGGGIQACTFSIDKKSCSC